MPLLIKILANSAAQLVGKFISATAAILISGLVFRSLGQTGFGEFTLMTTYAAMFYMAADFGFNAIVLRQAGGNEAKLREYWADLLGLRIVYSLLLTFIALAVLSFFPYSAAVKLGTIVTILTIITQAIYNTANVVFQFRLRYELSVIASSANSLILLGLVYLLAQGNLSLFGIALSYVASGVVMAVLGLSLAQRLIGKVLPRFEIGKFSELISATLPVGLTLVFNLIYFRADTFILSFFRPTAEVGVYGAAYKIFEFVLVIPTFLMNALYPVLIKYYEENRPRFRSIVRISLLGLTGISVVGAAIGIIVAPTLLEVIYGPDSADAVLPFRLLLAAAPIFYLSSLYMWIMLILRRQKTLALIYGLGMIVNIALNIYLIPKFSYLAAAIITGVSEALILVLTYYFSRDWKADDKTV